MTKFTVEEVSATERRIHIEVDPERIDDHLARAYKSLAGKVRIPGFRPGKAPRRILEAHFKDEVERDVVQSLVQESYLEALQESPIIPVSSPRVKSDPLKPGEPFRYQVVVEVHPTIDPKDYEGLDLKREEVTITDEQVEKQIDQLRESRARLEDVEGRTVAQEGDFAVVDMDGTVDGKPFPGGKGENVNVSITPGDLLQGHLPEIVGLSVGESQEVTYRFPGDYRIPEVAGKEGHIKVVLKALKKRVVPAADDNLAAEMGAGTSLEDLKRRVREALTERETDRIEREQREQILKQLIERNPFEVPQSMLESAVDRMTRGAMSQLARQGLDVESLGSETERFREMMRGPALFELKSTMLLSAVAEREKLEVTDADLDEELTRLGQRQGVSADRLRSALSHDALQGIRQHLKEQKTLAFLKSKAKIS
jgi:trigger factor